MNHLHLAYSAPAPLVGPMMRMPPARGVTRSRVPPIPVSPAAKLVAIAKARDLALRDASRAESEGRHPKARRERQRAAEMQAALDRFSSECAS